MAAVQRDNAVTVSYLVLQTLPTIVALPAAAIVEVKPQLEIDKRETTELSDLLSVTFARSTPTWIVRIRCGDREFSAVASGVMRVEKWGAKSVVKMPCVQDGGFALFSDVLISDGRPSALVVKVDALFAGVPRTGN